MPTAQRAQTKQPDTKPAPPREAVAKRAYELYLQRGSVPGYELEDWLQAEAELVAQAALATNASR